MENVMKDTVRADGATVQEPIQAPAPQKPEWIQKAEQFLHKEIISWCPYFDASDGREVYWRVTLDTGEERAFYRLSDGYAKLGYGGYDDYPVYTNDFAAVKNAETIYLCQSERDALGLAREGLPTLSLYKVTRPNDEARLQKFYDLIDKKNIVVCLSGNREQQNWIKKLLKNVLSDHDCKVFHPQDGKLLSDVVAEHGVDYITTHAQTAAAAAVQRVSGEVLPAASGFGLDLIKLEEPLQLDRNPNESIKQTSINALEIMCKDSQCKQIRIRYNDLGGQIVVDGAPWRREIHGLDDTDITIIKTRMETYGLNSKDALCDALAIIAAQNHFHPIVEYLENLPPWDGVGRYPEFLPRYLGAPRTELTAATTKMLLTSGVMRVYRPGSKYDCCVILVGAQGAGKSTLVEHLAAHDPRYYLPSLNDFGDKAFDAIRGKWIVELAEMKATLRAKTNNEIKDYLSAIQDRHRDIYEKYSKDHPRQCIYIGTANDVECLPYDNTGNRRFIPIDCKKNKAEIHPLDDLLWSSIFVTLVTKKISDCCWKNIRASRSSQGCFAPQ